MVSSVVLHIPQTSSICCKFTPLTLIIHHNTLSSFLLILHSHLDSSSFLILLHFHLPLFLAILSYIIMFYFPYPLFFYITFQPHPPFFYTYLHSSYKYFINMPIHPASFIYLVCLPIAFLILHRSASSANIFFLTDYQSSNHHSFIFFF